MNATPKSAKLLGEEQPSDSPTAATSALVPLRLPAHWRKHTPQGFVGLDAVLEEVGRRMNPAEWGRLPGWELMPFRYDSRRKVYRAKWGLSLVKGIPVARSRLLATEVKSAELQSCTSVYRSVCNEVIRELEADKLKPYALHRPWGDVEMITVRGIWSTQSEWAFYSGLVVVPGRFGAPVTARVLVRADNLRHWCHQRDNKGNEQRAAEVRRRIGQAFRDFMAETGCRPSRNQVRDLCGSVMGEEALKPAAAFADVWNEIPLGQGGRPGKAARASFEAQREALLVRIKAAWAGGEMSPAEG